MMTPLLALPVSSESEEKEKEKGKLINTSSAVVIVVFYHLLHIDCLFSNFVPQMNFLALALGKLHFAKSLLTSAAAVLSFKIDYLFFQFSQPFPWWRFCHFWKLPFSLSAIWWGIQPKRPSRRWDNFGCISSPLWITNCRMVGKGWPESWLMK